MIPYLRRMQLVDPKTTRAQKWEYWNDYLPERIERQELNYPDAHGTRSHTRGRQIE